MITSDTSYNITLLFQSEEVQYDHSELLLYQGDILKEAGLYQKALDHIEKNKSKIVDPLSFLEMKGNGALIFVTTICMFILFSTLYSIFLNNTV